MQRFYDSRLRLGFDEHETKYATTNAAAFSVVIHEGEFLPRVLEVTTSVTNRVIAVHKAETVRGANRRSLPMHAGTAGERLFSLYPPNDKSLFLLTSYFRSTGMGVCEREKIVVTLYNYDPQATCDVAITGKSTHI